MQLSCHGTIPILRSEMIHRNRHRSLGLTCAVDCPKPWRLWEFWRMLSAEREIHPPSTFCLFESTNKRGGYVSISVVVIVWSAPTLQTLAETRVTVHRIMNHIALVYPCESDKYTSYLGTSRATNKLKRANVTQLHAAQRASNHCHGLALGPHFHLDCEGEQMETVKWRPSHKERPKKNTHPTYR